MFKSEQSDVTAFLQKQGGLVCKALRSKRLAKIVLLLMVAVIFCGIWANAQGRAEVEFYSQYYGRYVSRYSGGTVTVDLSDTPQDFTREGCANGGTVCGHWEGAQTANVSDLDIENTVVEEGCCDGFGLTSNQGFGFMLVCKGVDKCVSEAGRFTGFDPPSSGIGTSHELVVSCETRSECTDFLDALKGRQKPVANSRAENAPQVQPPQPRSVSIPPPQAAVPARAGTDNGLRDVLDGITWRNGASGTKTLDELAKKTAPAPKPSRPGSQRPMYVAFAQSGGFNANDKTGSAMDADLNSAITKANVDCVTKAGTTCDDQGYCMLRPRLWGAWFSDQKYLGNKAFACNLKTHQEAIDQAQAWCGNGCIQQWADAAP